MHDFATVTLDVGVEKLVRDRREAHCLKTLHDISVSEIIELVYYPMEENNHVTKC